MAAGDGTGFKESELMLFLNDCHCEDPHTHRE